MGSLRRAPPSPTLGEGLQVFAEPRLQGPQCLAFETLDEAADGPSVLERQPRIPLAPLGRGRQADGRRRRSAPPRPAPVANRLDGRRAWSTASRSAARTGAARRSASMRSMIAVRARSWRRVHVEQLVDQIGAPSTTGNRSRAHAREAPPSGTLVARSTSSDRAPVACVRPAAHIPADRAAVVPLDRSSRSVALTGPGELVRDQHPATRRAAGREEIAHRDLEA